MNDIFEIILKHCDAVSSVRLVRAIKYFYVSKKTDFNFWTQLEARMPHFNKYNMYKIINKHMGVRRRILSWTSYFDAPCSLCHLPLFQTCTDTFPLRLKLCNNCRQDHIITEEVISRYLPFYVILNVRQNVNYCFLMNNNNRKVRSYYRPAVLRYLQNANFF